MTAPFSGGCMCGAIRYECSAEPLGVAYCYCRDCQRSSGGPFSTIVIVPASAVKIQRGQAKGYAVKGESGNTVTRFFCTECGAPLYSEAQAAPTARFVKAASLDDPSRVKPGMAIWTSSAQPWAEIPQGLQRFEKNPPL